MNKVDTTNCKKKQSIFFYSTALYCATGILRHRHTAPQVYYVTDILRHRTYYVTCLEGHVIPFLGIYMSFFSSLENLPSRFLLYLIYIYSDISHQNSWQITWSFHPGPPTLTNLRAVSLAIDPGIRNSGNHYSISY
jgi:hypothetical protein